MSDNRLRDVRLDGSFGSVGPDAEHERRVAVFDLIEQNSFALEGLEAGPYALTLSIQEGRLVFDVAGADGATAKVFVLSLQPLRKVVRDYMLICESYYAAIRGASPGQIESIDMGRRGLHNEGSELLRERLSGKVLVDHETARRLFTLICALHVRD
jgi:uncharacterized protein (UPF0262 family)